MSHFNYLNLISYLSRQSRETGEKVKYEVSLSKAYDATSCLMSYITDVDQLIGLGLRCESGPPRLERLKIAWQKAI